MKNEQIRICQGDKLKGRGDAWYGDGTSQGTDAQNALVTVPMRAVMRAKTRNPWVQTVTHRGTNIILCAGSAILCSR